MMPHSFLSPSGAPAWMRCNAKPWRELGAPDTSGDDAREGTAAHYLLEMCLDGQEDAALFVGKVIRVTDGNTEFHQDGQYPVGPEMIREVQKALDYIRKVADGATIYPEEEYPIAFITGEYRHKETGAVCFLDGEAFTDILTGEVYHENLVEPATGTADATVIKGPVAHVFDLKYGMGVQVFAEGNEQLLMYGAAAVELLDILGEVEELVLHIAQPRLNHFDQWVINMDTVREWVKLMGTTAKRIFNRIDLVAIPGEKQCRFCKIKGTCEEMRNSVLETVADGFVDLDKGFVQVSVDQAEKLLAQSFGVKQKDIDFQEELSCFVIKKPSITPTLEEAQARIATADDARLATLMDAAPMLEELVKSVRAEVERRLLAGAFTDARYKLVEGRMGNREFQDEAQAEAEMKSMRLKTDEMYNRKLISPTQAEALLKESSPRKWKRLEALIVRREGKPSVAPASDKRPALSIAIADSFEVLEDGSDLV